MSRFAPVVPTVLALVLAASACGPGGVQGTPGGSGVRDPYFPKSGNGGYDVTHYDLTLDYTPASRRLTGRAVISARATQDLSAFNLDLLGLDVTKVGVDGAAASWNRAGQELTVRPRDGLDKGRTFRVAVDYSGTPRTITDPDGSEEGWLPTSDGALALGQPVGSMAWFPGNHHPSDKATYEITVTVPENLRAVSNGEPAGETTSGGRRTAIWRSTAPMASYLATVAVGRFGITRTTGDDGLPLYTAVDPAERAGSRASLARIPDVLAWAEDRFGPYPFSSGGAIVDRANGIGYALETQNRPVFPGAPDLLLVVHELAHQWYGDSVTPMSWRDMWLNEGFATYAEWLWQEDHGGDTAQEIFDALYAGDYYEVPAENEAIWAFPPANPPDAASISDAPVYSRGAMVLHKIRETVGDQAFDRIVRGWAAAHRHGNADTGEFVTYVEEKAPGKDFTTIWDEWLYGKGRPSRP
ncbi:M1 family metallopeptidase [Streptomyces cadmiisoli]|uniref:Aminopeptidase N n=1 Tax=Streptomyces cadmiisoli TaxID=2184053 RepID=A0A2Z4J176_9ACTN|nr:M1 family metallopeptidase [Streptomyces cadmiisoli]AWW38922.1 M1 family peptidase [Streptomyces cadmiisoli]